MLAGAASKAVTAAQVQEALDQVQGAEHEDDFIQVSICSSTRECFRAELHATS